jgi:hypothetical protein
MIMGLVSALMKRKSMLTSAEIELEHIAVELRNGRGQHLRHFIDQYYCYKLDIVTRGGRADWERLMEVGVMSKAAAVELDRKKLVKEHVVPLSFIRSRLLEKTAQGEPTHESIAKVIDQYFVIGTITKIEDAKLRSLKLHSSMPSDFKNPTSPMCGDLFSRYRAAGIDFFALPKYSFGPVDVRWQKMMP